MIIGFGMTDQYGNLVAFGKTQQLAATSYKQAVLVIPKVKKEGK